MGGQFRSRNLCLTPKPTNGGCGFWIQLVGLADFPTCLTLVSGLTLPSLIIVTMVEFFVQYLAGSGCSTYISS